MSPEELRQQIADAVFHVWQNPPESPCFFPEPFADAVLALPAIRRALAITAAPVGGVEWCTTHLGVRNEDEELLVSDGQVSLLTLQRKLRVGFVTARILHERLVASGAVVASRTKEPQ